MKGSKGSAQPFDTDQIELVRASARKCPFCGSKDVRGFWSSTCPECTAKYSCSVFETGIPFSGVVALQKGVQYHKPEVILLGALILLGFLILYVSRRSTAGTWRLEKSAIGDVDLETIRASVRNRQDLEEFGQLMSAIKRGRVGDVKKLVQANARLVLCVDSQNFTPLALAERDGNAEIARSLRAATETQIEKFLDKKYGREDHSMSQPESDLIPPEERPNFGVRTQIRRILIGLIFVATLVTIGLSLYESSNNYRRGVMNSDDLSTGLFDRVKALVGIRDG